MDPAIKNFSERSVQVRYEISEIDISLLLCFCLCILIDLTRNIFLCDGTQSRIDSHFMTYRDDQRFAKISSSRLQKAVIQITGKRTSLSVSADNAQSKPANSRKRKKPAGDN